MQRARLHGAGLALGGVAVGERLQVLGDCRGRLLERLDQIRRVPLLLLARVDERDRRALIPGAPCANTCKLTVSGLPAAVLSSTDL